jgi:putative mycofactocin binding protein MftB
MALDPQRPYRLHPQVALRPEPFGALAYHYGNRRLTFLKSATLVELVSALEGHESVSEALDALAIPGAERPRYQRALESLERAEVIQAAAVPPTGDPGGDQPAPPEPRGDR